MASAPVGVEKKEVKPGIIVESLWDASKRLLSFVVQNQRKTPVDFRVLHQPFQFVFLQISEEIYDFVQDRFAR